MDHASAGLKADEIIAGEVDRQDKMWGVANERTDSAKGQLLGAGLAQLAALYERRAGNLDAFKEPATSYPNDWNGFRDYGSDVANLAVAAAPVPTLRAHRAMWRLSRIRAINPLSNSNANGHRQGTRQRRCRVTRRGDGPRGQVRSREASA